MSASRKNITKAIVPQANQSGPLTREELMPVSEFVYAEGIDLIKAGRSYLAEREGGQAEGIPSLAAVVENASSGALLRDIRILIDMDTDVFKQQGHKNYEKYYSAITHRKISRSTLWRRRLHAEFALLLGAQGRPEILPSQRQCEQIRKNLTRSEGIKFLLELGDPSRLCRMGESKLSEELDTYREKYNLPSVGSCPDDAAGPAVPNGSVARTIDEEPETNLFLSISKILREGAQNLKLSPLQASVAVVNQFFELEIKESTQQVELAARIVDQLFHTSNNIAVPASRVCLIRFISGILDSMLTKP